MYTDYKIWFIKQDNNGFIEEVGVRFYEGDYIIENEEEKYRSLKRLSKFKDLEYLAKDLGGEKLIKGITENNGKFAVYFSREDFGDIKTQEELTLFLDKKLAEDPIRKPKLWQL